MPSDASDSSLYWGPMRHPSSDASDRSITCFITTSAQEDMYVSLLWPPYVIWQAIIFLPRGFFFMAVLLKEADNADHADDGN